MSPDESRLDAQAMRSALRGCTIGRDVLVLDETTSTNDLVFSIATPATPQGLVVFAERQTAGRGQHGRRWESVSGKGLWFSILLRPPITAAESPRLTRWAAETVAETFRREFSLDAIVKPPNDVYVAKRKVAGVLLEMRVAPGGQQLGILGLGINVNHAAGDFPAELRERAGSLAMELARPLDRQAVAIAILRRLNLTRDL